MFRTAMAVILLAGAGLRIDIAFAQFPVSGDPTFSYLYRAELIAAGDWRGVKLMWHPPGYPLLLAAVRTVIGSSLSLYWAAVGINIFASAALVVQVDRMIRARVRWLATRIVVASFLSFYEMLVLCGSIPVTEPIYLCLLVGTLAILDVPRVVLGRAFAAGVLLGLATTFRFEALAAVAGLSFYLLLIAIRPMESCRSSPWCVPALLAGFGLLAGWLFVPGDYFAFCRAAQRGAYNFPPAESAGAIPVRAAASLYHAMTVWLPLTLLLPYWIIIGAGLGGEKPDGDGRRLSGLWLAVLLPTFAIIVWSIMHKRTGSFLLPSAAIWFGFGWEVFCLRAKFAGKGIAVAAAVAVFANAAQAARLFIGKTANDQNALTQTRSMARAIQAAGYRGETVWAFGSEPEIYSWLHAPVYYPYRDTKEYDSAFTGNRNHPAAFIESLRKAGFGFLAFTIPAGGKADQPYGLASGGQPTLEELERIQADAAALGLEPLAVPAASTAKCRVYRIRRGD